MCSAKHYLIPRAFPSIISDFVSHIALSKFTCMFLESVSFAILFVKIVIAYIFSTRCEKLACKHELVWDQSFQPTGMRPTLNV